LAPGDPTESIELTNQAFYFSHKYKVPSIIVSDKHLGESFYTLTEKPKLTKSSKSSELIRYNSYETDAMGSATEKPELIFKNIEKRNKKMQDMQKDIPKFSPYKSYGKKGAKNIVLAWGSTKGAILDAINGLNVEFIQVLYLEPFADVIKELEKKNIILVENNSTAQLGQVLAEKTGIIIPDSNKILRYDGRPFFADELNQEIKKRIK
jgi:2-oxoglutarate ferredoxin oxidoreductase subunit alpha